MNFISKWFGDSEKENLKNMIGVYIQLFQQEREKTKELESKIEILNAKIISILENEINNSKNNLNTSSIEPLTELEEKIYTTILENPTLQNKEVAKLCKLTLGSFNVYKNKIKQKGYSFN